MEKCLGGTDKADIIRKCRFGHAPCRLRSSALDFSVGHGDVISLSVVDHAATKVRAFGSEYHIDKHAAQQNKSPDWNLTKLVLHLARNCHATETGQRHRSALLAIFHAKTPRMIDRWVVEVIAPSFLERYGIRHGERSWPDRHGREVHTAIHLWAPE